MEHQFSPSYLFSLIVPLVFESLLNMMIGMADTIMVASCGEAAVSAVSLVDSVSTLLIQLFTAFSTGGAVIVSQYLGRKDRPSALLSARNLIYISFSIALTLSILMLIFRSSVINAVFGAIEEDVRAYTGDYFVPILLSYPALAFFESLTAISRSEGKTARTMGTAILMNAINISGNAILIYIFDMGPRGAGIASFSSRVAGCILMLSLMHRRDEELSMKSLITTLGTASIAINAVVMNFNSYSNIPGNGINLALITIIGQCRGKDNFKDINYYTKLMMLIVYISTLIITIPLYILSPLVIHLYGLESTTAITALPIARGCLMACLLIWPFAFTLPNTLKANGDVKFIMLTSFFSMWIFRVALSYLLIKHFGFGVEGVWYSMYADWAFRGVLYFLRYRGGKWKEKAVI